jgi:hypothetical protein
MDNLSSSRIHEDAIIFSTRKINAWNATIQRGSVIILGGDREILRDVLDYKKASATNTELPSSRSGVEQATLAEKNSKANTIAGKHDLILASSSLPPDEDFHVIQANEIKVEFYIAPSSDYFNEHTDL